MGEQRKYLIKIITKIWRRRGNVYVLPWNEFQDRGKGNFLPTPETTLMPGNKIKRGPAESRKFLHIWATNIEKHHYNLCVIPQYSKYFVLIKRIFVLEYRNFDILFLVAHQDQNASATSFLFEQKMCFFLFNLGEILNGDLPPLSLSLADKIRKIVKHQILWLECVHQGIKTTFCVWK